MLWTHSDLPGASLRRLDAITRNNLVGDLVAQAAVLGVVVPFVHNRWIIAVWLVRWIPIAAIIGCRRSIRRGQPNRAVAQLCFGHAIGVLGSCFLLPELGPLALLVLVGDLSLLHFVGERMRWQLVVGLLVTASFGSLLCLQSWTGLAQEAPKELVVLAIVLHTIGTGLAVAQTHRDTYLDLAEANRKLFGMQDRISEAIGEARQQIGTAIIEGPVTDLHALHHSALRLSAKLSTEEASDASFEASRTCAESSAAAQLALKKLRAVSHGAIPDLLRKHGLSAALASLFEPAGHEFSSDAVERRHEPWVEGALYLCAAELVRLANRYDVHIQGSLAQSKSTVQLRLSSASGVSLFAFSPLVLDRLGAIGAVLTDRSSDTRVDLIVEVPVEVAADDSFIRPRTSDAEESALVSPETSARRILDSFVRSSLVAAVLGFVLTAAGWVAFRIATLGYIALCMSVVLVVLTIANVRLRKNDFEGCVIAMCMEIFGAGLFVTALEPRAGAISGLITALPVVLGLPHFTKVTLRWITALQIMALSAVMVLSFNHWSAVDSPVPLWLLIVVLPPTAAGVAFLVAGAVMTTIDETRRASAALRVTLQRIVGRADTEQQAIERDLHDGAQQQFVAISMQFKMLSKLATTSPDRAQRVALNIVDQIRRTREELLAVAEGTSLESLRVGDLRAALLTVVERTPERLRLSFGGTVPPLTPAVARAVYYCCMEAIQNAFKYSGERSYVHVSVRCDSSDMLRFEVSDDGTGFVPSRASGGPGQNGQNGQEGQEGQGLISMRSRMSELDGELDVQSALGRGTIVSGAVPLPVSVYS
jgi:signal transduction histidine kinase